MSQSKIIPTGFQSLDQILGGGFHNKSLNIVAARPGMGKTSFALQLAVGMANSSGKTIYFYLLENSEAQIKFRLKQQFGGAFDLPKTSIVFDDTPEITLNQMQEKLSNIQNLGAVFIDYMQLLNLHPQHKYGARKVIRDIKLLAEDVEVPIIVLSQVTRLVKWRLGHRPRLKDFLYEYENDTAVVYADTISFLHRDGYYDDDSDRTTAEIIVAKNCYGITDTLKFCWNAENLTFSEVKI